jgi:hypothetical protein
VSARLSPRLTQVSIVFFLWGFAYALVGKPQRPNWEPSPLPALANHGSLRRILGTYFVGPLLVGYSALKSEGFKATSMTGLAIFARGALSFCPYSSCGPMLASSSPTLSSPPAFPASKWRQTCSSLLAVPASCLRHASTLPRGSRESMQQYLPSSHRWPSSPTSTNWTCSVTCSV